MKGQGTFEFTSWDEKPWSEVEGTPKLTKASVSNRFSGTISGESTLEYLMVYAEPTKGMFLGLERIVGEVDGKSGSFVLQQNGTFEGETVHANWFVVPGSGTGDLPHLRGEGSFVAEHGQVATPYVLDYEL